jgi:SAM-dependent methyltransferase
MNLKLFIRNSKCVKRLFRFFDFQSETHNFIKLKLESLPKGANILDAGAGEQPFKKHCQNLNYFAQDFNKYSKPIKKRFDDAVNPDDYVYGQMNYVGDIWEIQEKDQFFDVILCTEVFEHIPYPIETIKEFSRLLKNNGLLIISSPMASLRHFDPYYFYSGFSDRWYEEILNKNGFSIEEIIPIGDYYRWIANEIFRVLGSNPNFVKVFLLMPSLIYFLTRKRTQESINTLNFEYIVFAKKLNNA